jgi:hypothetical protein
MGNVYGLDAMFFVLNATHSIQAVAKKNAGKHLAEADCIEIVQFSRE